MSESMRRNGGLVEVTTPDGNRKSIEQLWTEVNKTLDRIGEKKNMMTKQENALDLPQIKAEIGRLYLSAASTYLTLINLAREDKAVEEKLISFTSKKDIVDILSKRTDTCFQNAKKYGSSIKSGTPTTTLDDIKGQENVKAIVRSFVFLAKHPSLFDTYKIKGGLGLMMYGAPGTGKTMLAKCVTGIMPRMTFEEGVEVTKIHSVSGLIVPEEGMVKRRPFRSPHHTASILSLTGGGNKAMPGEVSLAHNGVLFLDEMPEYNRKALEALRQPIEDGKIAIARVNKSVVYPARFMLIASMNPCPCGYFGSTVKECTCTQREILRYVSKISGPLLDRIDLYVTVDNIGYGEFRSRAKEEDSATVRSRVEKARDIQLRRFKGTGIYTNAQMNNALIREYCKIDDESENLLKYAFESKNFSPRSATRILKTARTIADIAGREDISSEDVAEAVQYKTVDKKELILG